ncbi:nuclease-related domain-containing protein [Ectothiorhodospira shaposhnikovii]|uniref:nuclease-related domain-containing protein n=1 Tax=Ectothiorhodospira shaposhnikovii TaxID=1054 RepID=UPI0039A0F423
MLIKHPDDHSHHAEVLHGLMESYPGQADEIHRELLQVQLRESIHMFAELLEMQMDPLDENVVILHDLRLEHEGRFVEFDHLLINRNLQITLVDSVLVGCGSLRITATGDSLIWSEENNRWLTAYRQPLQELEEKAQILGQILDAGWWPKRMGIRLAHPIETCLVLDDHDRIVLDDPDAYASRVIKMGDFLPWYSKQRMKTPITQGAKALMQRAVNRVDLNSLERIGFDLADRHHAAPLDYYERLGLDQVAPISPDDHPAPEEEEMADIPAIETPAVEPEPEPEPEPKPHPKTAAGKKNTAPADEDRQPSSRIAAALKLKTPEFLAEMESRGLLKKNQKDQLELTPAGRKLGGKVKGRGGNRSFSWPKAAVEALFQNPESEQEKQT